MTTMTTYPPPARTVSKENRKTPPATLPPNRADGIGTVSYFAFRQWGWETRGWSETTRLSYTKRIRQADRWLADELGASVWSADTHHLKRWLSTVPEVAATRNQYRSALVAFYDWLGDIGLRDGNPAYPIPTIPEPHPLPKALDPDASARLAEAALRDDLYGHAAVVVPLYAGLRAAETVHLEWGDVDGDYLRVRGKGAKDRVVPIHPQVSRLLDRACGASARWVLPSPRGGWERPVNYATLRSRTVALGGEVGAGHVTAHVLRHSFASRLLEQGATVEEVAQLLGHASIKTTGVYLRARPVRLVEVVDRLSYDGE